MWSPWTKPPCPAGSPASRWDECHGSRRPSSPPFRPAALRGSDRRQWALIHLEQQWQENLLTVEGALLHQRAHDATLRERRGDTLVVRSLAVVSHTLGLSGQWRCGGIPASGRGHSPPRGNGRWRVFPVEYKRGRPKEHQADEVQLCAQAMCLEEMLCCEVAEGALYYGEPRRRTPVTFSPALRELVRQCAAEMHQLAQRHHTPKVRPTKACRSCSLKDLLPAAAGPPRLCLCVLGQSHGGSL